MTRDIPIRGVKRVPRDSGNLGTEIAKQLHEIFLDAMENRYKEILSFVGFMIPALGGFLLLLQQYETGGRTSGDALLLFLGTLSCQFLLTWGAMYALAVSYRYRYLQASCYKIEEHSGASQWIPKSFKPQQSTLKKRLMLSIAPGILQVHIFIFLSAIAVVGCSYYTLMTWTKLTQTGTNDMRQEVRDETTTSTSTVTGAAANTDSSTLNTRGVKATPYASSRIAPRSEKSSVPSKTMTSTAKITITSIKHVANLTDSIYPDAILITSGLFFALIYYLGSVHYPNKMNNIIRNLAHEKRERNLLLITGPSGSGKSTLIAHYCNQKSTSVPIPITTRPIRRGDSRRVHSVSVDEFHRLEEEGRLSLVAQNYGSRYGYFTEDISRDTIVLVEVDSETAIKQLKEGSSLVIRVVPARIEAIVLSREEYGETLEDRLADLAPQLQLDFIVSRMRAGEHLFVNQFNQASCEEFVNFVDSLTRGGSSNGKD